MELRKEKSTKDKVLYNTLHAIVLYTFAMKLWQKYLCLQMKKRQEIKPNRSSLDCEMNEMESEKAMEIDNENSESDEAVDSECNITDISLRMKKSAGINADTSSQSDDKGTESSSGYVVQNSNLAEVCHIVEC